MIAARYRGKLSEAPVTLALSLVAAGHWPQLVAASFAILVLWDSLARLRRLVDDVEFLVAFAVTPPTG
jgi:hypothetical protein